MAETRALIRARARTTRKAHFQPASGSEPKRNRAARPPRSGERQLPADRAAAQIDTERARAEAEYVPAAIMARLVGKIAAAPSPEMTWPVHSTARRLPPAGVDTPMARPTATMSAPPTSSRLRPKRSPSTPKVSSRTQTGTRNASDIQVSWAELVARSCWKSPLSTAGIASAICATTTASTAAISVPARMTYIRDGTYVRVLTLLRSSTQPAPTRNHEPPGFGTRYWHHIGALAHDLR